MYQYALCILAGSSITGTEHELSTEKAYRPEIVDVDEVSERKE